MKSILLLFIAVFVLLFNGSLSAQSKKELRIQNEKLSMEHFLLQAKFDSAKVAGVFLQEQLDAKTTEAEKFERQLLMLEADFISYFDTTKIDSVLKDKAIAWNDTLVHDQEKMLDLEEQFVNTIVDGEEISVIKDQYKKYIAFLYKTEIKYKEMAPFDTKDTFRKALLDLLKAFISAAEEEYAEMVMIYSKETEDLTDADYDRWAVITSNADKKEQLANDLFLLKQRIFAAEYHFKLKD